MQMILLDLEEPTELPSQGTLLQSKVARKALHGWNQPRTHEYCVLDISALQWFAICGVKNIEMFDLAYILKAAVQIGQNFGVQLFHDVDYFIQCSGLQT